MPVWLAYASLCVYLHNIVDSRAMPYPSANYVLFYHSPPMWHSTQTSAWTEGCTTHCMTWETTGLRLAKGWPLLVQHLPVACGLRLAKGWPLLVQHLPVAVSFHPCHTTHWNICPLDVWACVCLYMRVDMCLFTCVYAHAGITADYRVPWKVVFGSPN